MLKTIDVPGYGPYVCGRKRSELNLFPKFSESVVPRAFHDVDVIRAAAESALPIYASVENMLGNDRYGDCTCAAALKIQAIFDTAAGREYRAPRLADALWLYSQVTSPPFDPVTGANDNGAELQTVIARWQSQGLYLDGHGRIKAAYAVDASKPDEVRAALEACGLLYVGCDLPDAWTRISGTGFIWGMAGPPDPNAGHCTFWYGYNDVGVFDGTWGMEGTIPWDAVAAYFGGRTGEVYAVQAA